MVLKENVYNIRKNKRLYFILPTEIVVDKDIDFSTFSVAIIVHLFYLHDVDKYKRYLADIPEDIDIYIVSSVPEVLDLFSESRYIRIQKENRGRDVSALLVSCKNIINKYDYVCFIHDKKEKDERIASDVKQWNESLWTNTIANENYIRNVLGVLNRNSSIGILAPPEPASWAWDIWGEMFWQNNYENTKKFCDDLSLDYSIDPHIPPITIGTVLWFKSKALEKMFAIEWKYEDFMCEPLPNDGTNSHAIERSFAYFAQDAGYETGTILTKNYAEMQIALLSHGMGKALSVFRKVWGFNSLEVLERFEQEITDNSKLAQFLDANNNDIYMYGAGKVGRDCLRVIRRLGCEPKAVLVSQKQGQQDTMDHLPIIGINEVDIDKSYGIVVSVGLGLQAEVVKLLKSRGINNYICFLENR